MKVDTRNLPDIWTVELHISCDYFVTYLVILNFN